VPVLCVNKCRFSGQDVDRLCVCRPGAIIKDRIRYKNARKG